MYEIEKESFEEDAWAQSHLIALSNPDYGCFLSVMAVDRLDPTICNAFSASPPEHAMFKIAGYIAFSYHFGGDDSMDDRVEIVSLAVRPECRGHGIGRRLMQHAIEHATNFAQTPLMTLHVRVDNSSAIHLYVCNLNE